MRAETKIIQAICWMMLLFVAPAAYSVPGSGESAGNDREKVRIATMASDLANEVARRKYDVKPFSPEKGELTFENEFWHWHAVMAFGKGDLQADVTISKDRRSRKVDLELLSTEGRPEPLREPPRSVR